MCPQEEEEVYPGDPEMRPRPSETQAAPAQPPQRKHHRNREHFATIRTASLVSQSQWTCSEMLHNPTDATKLYYSFIIDEPWHWLLSV